jgi:imidazole glycerol-phosphate synthase subunit HisF
VSYGGGITSFQQAKDIFNSGIEKVILNKSAHKQPELITAIANAFGAQSVVVSIDVKKDWLGRYKVYTDNGTQSSGKDPVAFAKECERLGTGEILLNSIERDGTYEGYEIPIIKAVSHAINIPVLACGGAGSIAHFREALDAHATGVAAGSMFVFKRPHNAVLISYPTEKEFKENLYS